MSGCRNALCTDFSSVQNELADNSCLSPLPELEPGRNARQKEREVSKTYRVL